MRRTMTTGGFKLADSQKRRKTQGILGLCRRRPYCVVVVLFVLGYTAVALHLRYMTQEQTWIPPFNVLGPPTLVYDVRDLKRVWQWEISAGHYPSAQPPPMYVGSTASGNPASPVQSDGDASTVGTGARRVYVTPKVPLDNLAYPPRPVLGSAADLDIVMQHCDHSLGKSVRDCLKLLRNGAELDTASRRIRGGTAGQFHYVYITDLAEGAGQPRSVNETPGAYEPEGSTSYPGGLRVSHAKTDLVLPPLPIRGQHACQGDDRRIFHMFWTGPFNDKPYMALLSFLYTQNLGLHLPTDHPLLKCKTELWLWMSQPHWTRYKRATWEKRMYNELKASPWAAAFLHPRLSQVIHFKVWDVAEQLDSVDELKDEWRKYEHKVVKSKMARAPEDGVDDGVNDANYSAVLAASSPASSGSSQYDKPSVAHSDLVRFVVCHRFGGIYLDADTLLLRDWEELWGWRGAFAYRWSRMDRYNTAVLRMHANSALGTWLLRTALKNGLDFHPIRVSRYLRDAQTEGLLLRLPGALFDPAWLMVEGFETERPPQPLLNTFEDFFETPPLLGAGPEALGFDGFFKGAFSYHYHNNWWTPFDPQRDYPNLGPRFSNVKPPSIRFEEPAYELSWSAVMKRTFEAYLRGEQPNMYGEWLNW